MTINEGMHYAMAFVSQELFRHNHRHTSIIEIDQKRNKNIYYDLNPKYDIKLKCSNKIQALKAYELYDIVIV